MASPVQEVKIFGVQDRRLTGAGKNPWLVRWSIAGRQRSKSFRTKTEAERYRSYLQHAKTIGEPFDEVAGEPMSWLPAASDTPIHLWARRWLDEQWSEWQPRTRTSAVEALARFVPLVVAPPATPPPPGMRHHLTVTLRSGAATGAGDLECETWLDRWCLQLGQLNRQILADVEHHLSLRDSGDALSATMANRLRTIARSCIRRAVDLEILAVDPWPPTPRGRSRRKAVRTKGQVDVRLLPDPATMERAIAAIASHQPGSRTYQLMTAVAYYAGLRPSEVVMLRRRCLYLPATGWGRIDVVEADVSFDEPGEPKTGPRSVPIPPMLVEVLLNWIEAGSYANDDLIFRTSTGHRPSGSNWNRAWQRALRQVGHGPLRVYDCRHAAATTWLQAGAPLGEVARRLGHSVETLVSTYVGALVGDESVANSKIESALSAGVTRAESGVRSTP